MLSKLFLNIAVFLLAFALSAWIFYDMAENHMLLKYCTAGGWCTYQLLRN